MISSQNTKIASTAPAAPNKCPIDDLVELILISFILLENNLETEFSSISSPSGEVHEH